MFVLRIESGRLLWIGGVFGSRDALEEYLAHLPDGDRWRPQVIELPGLCYPLYICEDHEGFRFLPEEAVIAELSRYAGELRKEDEDWVYTNLYRVAEDWKTRDPGWDQMGVLPHHHVTNDTLNWIARNGFQSLWSREA
jgi:hypothetical protein